MKRPEPPCRSCSNRKVGCSTSCEGYVSFREGLNEYNTLIFNAKQKGAEAIDFEISSYERGKKRRNLKP